MNAIPKPTADHPRTLPRAKFPDSETILKALEAIPKLVLWKIAGYEILRRLSPGEASKVQVVIANYWETHDLLEAARDVEKILLVGPQRLVQGHLKGADWDEGIRKVRLKMRELRETLAAVAKEWRIVLESVERSPVAPRAAMKECAEKKMPALPMEVAPPVPPVESAA